MKRLYFLIAILFPLLLIGQSNSEYFYYYKGKKQYLEVNTNYVFVSTDTKQLPKKYVSSFTQSTIKLKKENIWDKVQLKRSFDNLYWSELKLQKRVSKKDYFNFINNLKSEKNIQTVSPYFKTEDTDKIGLSNFFYVKLKQMSDIGILQKQARKHSCLIVQQDKFMPLWFVLSVTKQSRKNALQLANLFYESGLFEFAEPDLMVDDILNCANDDFFNNQWNLKNTGQLGGTLGVDIKACDAWNIAKGENVIVAVVDHGIELNHPDLQANIYPLSYDTESGTSPSQVLGNHGTACAGIIGADDNNIGISGVAPDCKLMSISNSLVGTPLSRKKRGEGINWAVSKGADVISNSWGSGVHYQIIDDAISNAINNGRNGLGCIVVFASGNNNSSVNYPANSNPNILVVGAMSMCGERKNPNSCDNETWWGSNYGNELDVVAPGVKIYTTDRQGNAGYNPPPPGHGSDINNLDYTKKFNGTSSACPHVAGVAALILSVNPNLTGQQVRDIIEKTVQKVGNYSYTTHSNRPNGGWNNEMGYGLVNAFEAVQAACGTTYFTNQTVTNNTTVQDCNVIIRNVKVKNSAKLTVKGIKKTIIQKDFEVKAGSKLEIK